MPTSKKITIAAVIIAIILTLATLNSIINGGNGDKNSDSNVAANSTSAVTSADFAVNDNSFENDNNGNSLIETFAPIIEQRPDAASDDTSIADNRDNSSGEMYIVYNDPSDFDKINYRNDAIIVNIQGSWGGGIHDYFKRNGLLENYKNDVLIAGGMTSESKSEYLIEFTSPMSDEELDACINSWKEHLSKQGDDYNAYLVNVDYKVIDVFGNDPYDTTPKERLDSPPPYAAT